VARALVLRYYRDLYKLDLDPEALAGQTDGLVCSDLHDLAKAMRTFGAAVVDAEIARLRARDTTQYKPPEARRRRRR
jgi:hypothetical protein